MVHITYRHGLDRSEDKRMILKDSNFYISEYKCHDLHFIQY
jgi:hypothetical protein